MSDFDRYVEIKGFSEIENNEESFAETFLKLEGDNVIYNATAKEVFIYSNTNWVKETNKETKRCDVLKKTIRVVLSRFISNRIKRLETEEIGYSEDAMKKKSEKNAMYL